MGIRPRLRSCITLLDLTLKVNYRYKDFSLWHQINNKRHSWEGFVSPAPCQSHFPALQVKAASVGPKSLQVLLRKTKTPRLDLYVRYDLLFNVFLKKKCLLPASLLLWPAVNWTFWQFSHTTTPADANSPAQAQARTQDSPRGATNHPATLIEYRRVLLAWPPTSLSSGGWG